MTTETSHDREPQMEDAERNRDPSLDRLDDREDAEELRERYYGLIQELRTMLPGAQVLVAFLLTVPFSNRFEDLDELGHFTYAASLAAGVLSIVAFTTPTALHRVGPRRSRSERLLWGIRMARVGLAMLAVSLIAAVTTVARFALSDLVGSIVVVLTAASLATFWLILPATALRRGVPRA
jgi:hypothetical protein